MSIISLQYGQCGNQIGQSLFTNIYNDIKSNPDPCSHYTQQATNTWFNVTTGGKWEPRSIRIDTETKVVECAGKNVPFRFRNVVARSCGGSANNWAYGYRDRSPLLADDVQEAVRCEVEKCDRVASLLNVFGSAGGTGSGVGSKMTETLRDEYPNKIIVSVLVLPYASGEVVTQSYNCLLSLAGHYSHSDSVLVFENDRLHYICRNNLNIKDVTFGDINEIVAKQLLGLYQPLSSELASTTSLIADLTARQSYKLLQLKYAPYIYKAVEQFEILPNWKSLAATILKQYRFDYQQYSSSLIRVKPKTISSALICRGGLSPPADLALKHLKDPNDFVSWLPDEEKGKVYYQPKRLKSIDSCLTCISNSNSVCIPLNAIIEDGWNLFTHGAYLHHYSKYGVDKEQFLEVFQTNENVLHNYKVL